MSSEFTRDLPSSVRAWAYTLSLRTHCQKMYRHSFQVPGSSQKLRVGIGIDVSASLDVEELAQFLHIDEVSFFRAALQT